jgi:cell division protein FtsB
MRIAQTMSSRLPIARMTSVRMHSVHVAFDAHAEHRKGRRRRGLVGLRIVFGVALFLFGIWHGRAGHFVVAIVVARVFRILF